MTIQSDSKNNVLTLTLNRPDKGNALNNPMLEGLRDRIRKARSQPALSALVLTGAGEKFFCAGADLNEFKASDYVAQGHSQQNYMELLKELRRFNKPTIARVQGAVRGGGLGLVLACDLVFAAEHASFATPEIKVGLFPMMVSALLFRELPKNIAFDMLYTGRALSAEDAKNQGLVKEIAPIAGLDSVMNTYLAQLRALSPWVLSLGKRAIAETRDQDFKTALETLNGYLSLNLNSADAHEGLTAFLEKTKAKVERPVNDWKNRGNDAQTGCAAS